MEFTVVGNGCSSARSRLKKTARRIVPDHIWRLLREAARQRRQRRAAASLRRLRSRFEAFPSGTKGSHRLLDYTVSFNHGLVCFLLYQDIFVNRIYQFDAVRPDPLILDCGSNIGISVLYFKHLYPRARVLAFEPDPELFPLLEENVRANGLTDVTSYQVAVAGEEGTLRLFADGKVGSSLSAKPSGSGNGEANACEVSAVRLGPYLREPVDFLKMNIEGAEWEVIEDMEPNLRRIREMVIEYHHLPGMPRTLHKILAVLDRQGFEYCVSDFGLAAYGGNRPPVRLGPDARYFRHLYAFRIE